MKNKKELQRSIHKHSVEATQSLQRIKMHLQAEASEKDLEARKLAMLKGDILKVENIIEYILCLESMNEYYETSPSLFGKEDIV